MQKFFLYQGFRYKYDQYAGDSKALWHAASLQDFEKICLLKGSFSLCHSEEISNFLALCEDEGHEPCVDGSYVAPKEGEVQHRTVPLVFLHGFMQSSATWEGVVARFAKGYEEGKKRCCSLETSSFLQHDEGSLAASFLSHRSSKTSFSIPVFALNLVGCAENDCMHKRAVRSMDEACDMLAAFLGYVREMIGAKPVVVGYSMGGRLALVTAVRRPDLFRALVLESAGLGPRTDEERNEKAQRNKEWSALLQEGGVEAFVDSWEQLPLFATQKRLGADIRAQVRRRRLAHSADVLINLLEQVGAHNMPHCWDAVCEMAFPLLYIAGDLDSSYSALAKELARKSEQCKADRCVALVKGAGHNVHLEDEKAFLQVLAKFFAKFCLQEDARRLPYRAVF